MFRNARVYSVPPERSAWYVTGKVGDPQFEKWFENARNQASKEPKEIQLPGYRLEPNTKHEEKEWDREKKLLILLRENGGEADSISDIIRWFGHKAASSTLRKKFSRIVTKLEMKGLSMLRRGVR